MPRRLFVALALVSTLAIACDKAESDALPSVRLGMSPRDVRDRFEPGASGSWQTRVGVGDDTVLEWNARPAARARIVDARFEFHLGMLVAVRAHLEDPVAKDSISVTARTVTHRAPREGGVGSSVTILARDCPTHREEAEGLAARAARGR
ncbi:MAG: hypothetical protein KF819_28465 [Labilithrix sp.]|nr:hypothetical protein [Labilithrix sp.]